MKQEPCGLVCHAKHPLKLLGAHALLGRGHELRGENPLVEGNLGPFHDGSDSYGEGLPAVLALVNAGASGLALEFGDAVTIDTATRADGAVRPEQGFEMLPGFRLVVIDRVGNIDVHNLVPLPALDIWELGHGTSSRYFPLVRPVPS